MDKLMLSVASDCPASVLVGALRAGRRLSWRGLGKSGPWSQDSALPQPHVCPRGGQGHWRSCWVLGLED